MKFIEEFSYDMDFREPRIILKDNICIIENVKTIIMIGDKAVTVEASKKYVTVVGDNFVIAEIKDGRLLIEGEIQGVELLHTSNKDKDRRI